MRILIVVCVTIVYVYGEQQQQQQQQQSGAVAAPVVGPPVPVQPVVPLTESQEAFECPQGWCYSQGLFCGYNVCPEMQGFKNLYYCKGYGWAPKLVDSCNLGCVDSRSGSDSCYPL